MDSDRTITHATVVTEKGRIAAVAPMRAVRVPKGARRIDGRGKFLMPGLADMHVHLSGPGRPLKNEDSATLFLANGVTTVRNMWGSEDTLAFRKSIAQGAVTGPQIFTTGPITDGNPPSRPFSRVVETVSQAVDAVNSDKRQGYDAVKVYSRLSPEAYKAIVATARTIDLPVYGHVPNRVGVEGVLDARQDSIEHVDGYLDALDRDQSPGKASNLVRETVQAGAWNCVTLVFYQGAVPANEASILLDRPSMRFVPPAMLTLWKNNPQLASLTAYQFGRIRLYDQKRRDFVRALHQGGAKILLGTDTPNPFVVPGFAVHEELHNLVGVGFTPYEAIRAGTSDAAEFLKSADQWGTIRVGLRADLILLEANPLQDVANASRRAGVMLAGRWTPEAELKASLNSLAESYKRAVPPR
jgi:imidazolonepropionase-like amidohydrolase